MAGLLLVAGALVAPGGPAYADEAGLGGNYVPLTPAVRVVDSRSALGVSGALGAGSIVNFPVLGGDGMPSKDDGVQAVLVDLTAVSPTTQTHMVLWPYGQDRPVGSSLNANTTLSNSAVVPIGDDGRLSLYNMAGTVHVVVDVQGYFTTVGGTPGSTGGGFVPVPYTAMVDTRTGLGTAEGAIPANGSRTVTLTGGVFPTGAPAAYLNIIAANASASGWLEARPAGSSSGLSILDYAPGTTSEGAAVALSSTGQVTFVNHGAAVHLALTGEGYFTGSPATGAGMRAMTTTRLLDTGLSSGGTVDLQVGGAAGLPTRAVAGAAVNLTVASATGSGNLTASPYGGTETGRTLVNFTADTAPRASMAVLPVGTEGKVRIKNASTGTIRLVVDLQGWFADPLPRLEKIPDTPVLAAQMTPVGTALGTVEYAWVDDAGKVIWTHQADPDNFASLPQQPISGYDSYVGPPVIGQTSDGRLSITGQQTDSNIWSSSKTTVDGSAWNDWSNLGGSMATPPVSIKLADGTTVLFAVDADGRLWHYRPVGSTSYWRSLGQADLTGQLAVVEASYGGARLFAVDTDGSLRTAVYTTDGSLDAWTDLGATALGTTPAAVVHPGYAAQVFIRSADGTLLTKQQDSGGAWPAQWSAVGTFVAAGAPAAIIDPSGRTAVVARGTDNEMYRVFETAVGSGQWGTWAMVNGDQISDPGVTDPTVAPVTNSNGQTWIIVFRNVNNVVRVYTRSLSSAAAARASAVAGGEQFTGHSLPVPEK